MIVLCPQQNATEISEFFQNDCHIKRLGSKCLITHPAGRYQHPDGLFIGHSVDHEAKRVVFSDAEPFRWPSVATPKEGCYLRAEHCRVSPNGNPVIKLGGDKFRLLPILYFFDGETLATSDSLFLLTELRRHLGLSVKVHEEAALSRLWQNGIADQLLSVETPVSDIYFCPVGMHLEASMHHGPLGLRIVRNNVRELFSSGELSYAEVVTRGAGRIASVIATACSIPGAAVSLDLSGGFDSRVSFAAASYAGLLDSIRVTSSKRMEPDYIIASQIADKFGISLNRESRLPSKRVRLASPLAQWAIFSAGIYDPLYSGGAYRSSAAQFKISGHGAELYKGNYGWRRLRAISRHVPPVARAAFRSQAEKGLEAIGILPDDQWGSEWCYLAYRNSVHSGRVTMTNLIGLRPLLQSELLGLSRSDKNAFPAPKKCAPSIVSDLLIALSPQLAAMPYDTVEKNLSAQFIAERKRDLGEPPPVIAYEVSGSPDAVPSGPSASALLLAERRGFSGEFGDNPNVVRLIRQGYDAAPAYLKDALQALLPDAMNSTGRSSSSHRAARAAGKLMMLALLDA